MSFLAVFSILVSLSDVATLIIDELHERCVVPLENIIQYVATFGGYGSW